jgi:hypothetical protein
VIRHCRFSPIRQLAKMIVDLSLEFLSVLSPDHNCQGVLSFVLAQDRFKHSLSSGVLRTTVATVSSRRSGNRPIIADLSLEFELVLTAHYFRYFAVNHKESDATGPLVGKACCSTQSLSCHFQDVTVLGCPGTTRNVEHNIFLI